MSEKYNSKDRFLEFSKEAHYLRVDAEHPLELLIGKDDKGYKTIRLIADFKKQNIKGTKAISILHYRFRTKLALNISLIDEEYSDLFYLMCDDLIDSSRICTSENGYNYIINRFEKWKHFTDSKTEYLPENQIKGLLAEILILDKHLIDKYGTSKAIAGWTGTQPTIKDFTYEENWYEIKATTSNEITINSIEQLESEILGLLIVVTFEKMSSESNGISLNTVFESIINKMDSNIDRSIFLMKLLELGYHQNEYYDNFKYRVISFSYFKVTENFPKIKKKEIDSAITKVKYTLSLEMLEGYKGSFE